MKDRDHQSYLSRVRADLAALAEELDALLDGSTIRYVNPNRPGSPLVFVMAADWGWGASDEKTAVAQMDLIERYSDWSERFMLLLPNPTPDVRRKITDADKFFRRWVARDGGFDHFIPQTIDQAKVIAARELAVFAELLDLAAYRGDATVRVVPDTNTLLSNPAVEEYAPVVGSSAYLVHIVIVTTVLGELDELKDRGRTPDVREEAAKAVRRLKGYRDRGSLAEGVTVAGVSPLGGAGSVLTHSHLECHLPA